MPLPKSLEIPSCLLTSCVAIASIAGPLGAQSIELAAETAVGVQAGTSTHSIPASRAITASTTLWARSPRSNAGLAMCSTTIAPIVEPLVGGVRIQDFGISQSLSASGLTATTAPAPRSLVLTIRAASQKGVLLIAYAPQVSASAGVPKASAWAAVDVGADGTPEWSDSSANATHAGKTIPVVVTGQLRIRIVTGGSAISGGAASWFTSFGNSLWISWMPEVCKISTYAKGCGPKLAAAQVGIAPTTVEVALSGAFPSAPGLFSIGLSPTSVQFPGTSCFFLVNALFTVPLVTDASGKLTARSIVPQGLAGKIYIQALSLRLSPSFGIMLSDGVLLDCP